MAELIVLDEREAEGGTDGKARPGNEWRGAKSLEEASANPPPGQVPVVHDKSLISEKLALTKLQSSQLLREFLSAHAPVLEWDNIHQSYKAHSKFKAH